MTSTHNIRPILYGIRNGILQNISKASKTRQKEDIIQDDRRFMTCFAISRKAFTRFVRDFFIVFPLSLYLREIIS